MIKISLKGDSLDSITEKQHAQLRKRFLKDAAKHYSKEAWDDPYLKGLAKVGLGFGLGGLSLMYLMESGWFVIPAGAGVMNMCQAWYKKHTATKAMKDVLNARTKHMTYEQLEQRVEKQDFSIPEATKEEKEQMSIDLYSLKVMMAVAKNDYKLFKYPWTATGIGIAAYGGYQSFTDEPIAGGLTLAAGSIVFLVSNFVKSRKIANTFKKAKSFLEQKGYAYFDNYVRRKDPYDFYQIHVLGKQPT